MINKTELDGERVKKLESQMNDLKAKREQEVKDFNVKMNSLWLVDPEVDLKNHCSKVTMGYVTQGGYSYRRGRVCGLGFVPLLALYEYSMLNEDEKVGKLNSRVLVRETNSEHYHWATIDVIV